MTSDLWVGRHVCPNLTKLDLGKMENLLKSDVRNQKLRSFYDQTFE